MYSKIISELIDVAPNLTVVKVFNLLTRKNQFEGGVVLNKTYIANEMKISKSAALKAFKWLEDNHYLMETNTNGIPKFILKSKIDDKNIEAGDKIV